MLKMTFYLLLLDVLKNQDLKNSCYNSNYSLGNIFLFCVFMFIILFVFLCACPVECGGGEERGGGRGWCGDGKQSGEERLRRWNQPYPAQRGERDHNGRRNITRISGDMDTIPHICW